MNNSLRRASLLAASLSAAVIANCGVGFAQTGVPIRLVDSSTVIVSVTINGSGPMDFVLDTGTDTTIIDRDCARDLGVVPTENVSLNTLSGSVKLGRSYAKLAMGTAEQRGVEVLIDDLRELRRIDPRIRGIVGENFLGRFNYELDYSRRVIRFEQGDELRRTLTGEQMPMTVADDKILVDSEACGTREGALRLALDSGANTVVLIHRSAQMLSMTGKNDATETSGNGHVFVREGRLASLTFGAQRLHDLPVALMPDGASDAERQEDGLLPTALFHAIYVNNRDGYVIFNPKTK